MEKIDNLSDAVGMIHAKASILINRTGTLLATLQQINQDISRNAPVSLQINVAQEHQLLGTMNCVDATIAQTINKVEECEYYLLDLANDLLWQSAVNCAKISKKTIKREREPVVEET